MAGIGDSVLKKTVGGSDSQIGNDDLSLDVLSFNSDSEDKHRK